MHVINAIQLRRHKTRSQLFHRMINPLTNAVDRYTVRDRFLMVQIRHYRAKKATCKFYNIDVCPELVNFKSVASEVLNSNTKPIHLQSSNQQNIHHYFFLLFWTTGAYIGEIHCWLQSTSVIHTIRFLTFSLTSALDSSFHLGLPTSKLTPKSACQTNPQSEGHCCVKSHTLHMH